MKNIIAIIVKHKLKLIFLIFIIFSLCSIYVGKILFIKYCGISIHPNKIYKPRALKFYLQNNPLWKSEPMGQSKYTLGGHGCLVSVLSTALTDLGYKTDVKSLNTLFTNNGVYTKNGNVIWYKINEIIPNINYSFKRIFDNEIIEHDLQNGRLPIVRVKYYKGGIDHWVLIAGSDENEFIIIDPLMKHKKYIKLSNHGKVYAYRVLYRVE